MDGAKVRHAQLGVFVLRLFPTIVQLILKDNIPPNKLKRMFLEKTMNTALSDTDIDLMKLLPNMNNFTIDICYKILRFENSIGEPKCKWGNIPHDTEIAIADDVQRILNASNDVITKKSVDITKIFHNTFQNNVKRIIARVDVYLNGDTCQRLYQNLHFQQIAESELLQILEEIIKKHPIKVIQSTLTTTGQTKMREFYSRCAIVITDIFPDILRDILQLMISPQDLHKKFDKPFLMSFYPDQQTYLKTLKLNNSFSSLDIPIIYRILRHFSLIPPPSKGWGQVPDPTDILLADDVERIRTMRNEIAHRCDANIDKNACGAFFLRFSEIGERIDKYFTGPKNYEQKVIDCRMCPIDTQMQTKYENAIKELENLKLHYESEPVRFYWGDTFENNLMNLQNMFKYEKLKGNEKFRVQIVLQTECDINTRTVSIINSLKDEINQGLIGIDFVVASLGSLVLCVDIMVEEMETDEKLQRVLYSFINKIIQTEIIGVSSTGYVDAVLVDSEDNAFFEMTKKETFTSSVVNLDFNIDASHFETEEKMKGAMIDIVENVHKKSNGTGIKGDIKATVMPFDFEADILSEFNEYSKSAQEFGDYWQSGLPIEIKELDKKSAKVFASLQKEEGYDHYEARVMLVGEQGTGKSTIARYLVGIGPTRMRMSTYWIHSYYGLSFIDGENEEWVNGKQGFTLSDVAISRSLRQMDDKSPNMNAKYKLTDQKSDGKSEESYQNVISSKESYVSATESFYIGSQKDQGLVQDKCLENKFSESLQDIDITAVSREKKTKTKATKEPYPVIARESDDEILPRDRKEVALSIVGLETKPSSFDDNMFPLTESSKVDEKEKGEFSRLKNHSKPHDESKEISSSTKVARDRGIIAKLKSLFGIQKDVTEVKVSMTYDIVLKESMKKVRKKKLHEKQIAPVIICVFRGQNVFFSTHQTFLSYRAIYLLVLDGSRTLDDPCTVDRYRLGKSGAKTARDYLRFWINTIVAYCKGSGIGFPKIMIVLTHKDKLEAVEVEPRRQQIFHEIEKMFSGSPLLSHLVIEVQLFVNARNEHDPEMAKIKTVITEQAMKQSSWGQTLPKCFIPLEWEFDSLLSRNIPLITMEQMRKINSCQPVRPLIEEELKVFLKFQHSVGRILYFDEENLDEHIILSPTHLIDAFKSILTERRFFDRKRQETWDLMSKKGIIEKKSIQDIWKKNYNKFQDHKEYLLGVMAYLDILVEPKRYNKTQTRISAEFYYVASMVRTSDTTGYLKSPTFAKRNIAIAFSHSSSMIPPALSFRFISYCLSIFAVKKFGQKDNEMLFHRSAIFNIDQSLDLCVNCDDEVIVVRLVHLKHQALIISDLVSSICECLAVALEKISQLYVKTSSTDHVTSKSFFNISLCCSSPDDPCLLPISTLQQQDSSWICPKHGIEHTKDMMSWAIQKDEIQCGKGCPVTDAEFLEQIPSDIHLRRLSMLYSINETKELAMHLGMYYQTWADLYVTFGEEPERLKFEVLLKTVVDTHLTFNDIRKAVEFGKIQTIHSLCKVVRGNPIDFDQEPEKWDLVPTEEHLDRVAPLVGNNSLSFLVELGMKFRTWEEIKYKQAERDLVKLNRHILQEWKSNFCSLHNIRPSLRDIGKAFNNIGKNIKIIEIVLADLL